MVGDNSSKYEIVIKLKIWIYIGVWKIEFFILKKMSFINYFYIDIFLVDEDYLGSSRLKI